MPRPKKYHTEEEKKAGDAARARKSYHNRRDDVCAARRQRYDILQSEKAAKKEPARAPLSEEERRIRHNISSSESYQRRKSEMQDRRREGRMVIPPLPLHDRLRGGLTASSWRSRLTNLAIRLTNALIGRTPIQYAQMVLKHCVKDNAGIKVDKERLGLRTIGEDIRVLQDQVLNTFGAGSQLKETKALLAKLNEAVAYLDDIGMAPLEEKPLPDLLNEFIVREKQLIMHAARENIM